MKKLSSKFYIVLISTSFINCNVQTNSFNNMLTPMLNKQTKKYRHYDSSIENDNQNALEVFTEIEKIIQNNLIVENSKITELLISRIYNKDKIFEALDTTIKNYQLIYDKFIINLILEYTSNYFLDKKFKYNRLHKLLILKRKENRWDISFLIEKKFKLNPFIKCCPNIFATCKCSNCICKNYYYLFCCLTK